jgi:hypothetical protein
MGTRCPLLQIFDRCFRESIERTVRRSVPTPQLPDRGGDDASTLHVVASDH